MPIAVSCHTALCASAYESLCQNPRLAVPILPAFRANSHGVALNSVPYRTGPPSRGFENPGFLRVFARFLCRIARVFGGVEAGKGGDPPCCAGFHGGLRSVCQMSRMHGLRPDSHWIRHAVPDCTGTRQPTRRSCAGLHGRESKIFVLNVPSRTGLMIRT